MNAMQINEVFTAHEAARFSSLSVRRDAVTYGSGLYAERAYRAGEIIARFDDAVPASKSYLTVQVSENQHLQLTVLSHMNHACRPNLVIDSASRTVSACRDIQAGEMLNFFYPSTEWQMDRPFTCECGAPECIGKVTGARELPVAVLSRYFINTHIVRLISQELRCGTVSS